MSNRRHAAVLLSLLCIGMAMPRTAASATFSTELNTACYDCTFSLSPSGAPPAPASAIRITLEAGQGQQHTELVITRQAIVVRALANGRETPCGRLPLTPADVPGRLLIHRRSAYLGLRINGVLRYAQTVPRAPGHLGTITVQAGWSQPTIAVQRLEPVVFADNFMRTADEPGPWRLDRGRWALHSAWDADPKGNAKRFAHADYALNPFAWLGSAGAESSALCTTGQPFWEDYTFHAAVLPAVESAVGIAVNLQDPRNGYLLRWTPVNAAAADRDRLMLCTMREGKLTVVAEDRGGYLPGLWYRMTVVSTLEGLTVQIDGRERLRLKNTTPWRGGVGLYVDGKHGALFDDVTVYGHALGTDLIAESVLARVNERFLTGPINQWAKTSIDWLPFPGMPNGFRYRWDGYGDQRIALTAMRSKAQPGEIRLSVQGNGIAADSGYRLIIESTDAMKKTMYTLYRETAVLATGTGEALATDVDYDFRLLQVGARLWAEQDGATILTAHDPRPLHGPSPSYSLSGSLLATNGPFVPGAARVDDTFAGAPVDWISDGVWMATTRWACSPQWSFLAGWSRGDAVLWSKQRFTGDQTLEAFVAPKMEYPRQHQPYAARFRDLAVTLCGDGRDPRSGYAGIYGAPDAQGTPNQRTVILRNGVVVASSPTRMPEWGAGHNRWFELVLAKHGAVIELTIDGERVLSFTDPHPLAGGVPAIWTRENGIAVARARIFAATPPQPRTEPQVALDTPWYPEWANVGETLALAFPTACSTTGHPVQLQATPRAVPPGEERAVTVAADRVQFTPATPGEHWYQITATDGMQTSPAVHLALPVFQPALGRDDTHALVLYRFDEGAGARVTDQSTVAPPADLQISASSTVRWLPGQGVQLSGNSRLASLAAVPKLMRIAETKACTIECWISTDTLYPTTDLLGCLLTWGLPDDQRNVGMAHLANYLVMAPHGVYYAGGGLTAEGMRVGLQHVAITWDGTTTRAYLNGVQVHESAFSWHHDQWRADARLYVGNDADGPQRSYRAEAYRLGGAPFDPADPDAQPQHGYLGAVYLVAIHEHCLSVADVLRHYRAGPSAR